MVSLPAQAGIQNFKAFDKTGLLPRAGMASGAIRLKCYPNRFFRSGSRPGGLGFYQQVNRAKHSPLVVIELENAYVD